MTVEEIAHTLGLAEYSNRFKQTIDRVFCERVNFDQLAQIGLQRGLPPFALREILAADPLAAFIPRAYGGRGVVVKECLTILDIASYASLPLGLMFGISGGLFLGPVAKYGQAEAKAEVFPRCLDDHHLGGLMITEPGFGTDALAMQTSFTATADGYRIRGVKHWAGLTGWADWWLLAARPRLDEGRLGFGPSLFICEVEGAGEGLVSEEMFANLGLYMIPYGRTRVDLDVPRRSRLEAGESSSLQIFADVLHRTRMQFPGIAVGFLRRLLDEALQHCRARRVGGRSLLDYDLVKQRLARIQAAFTAASAMCVHASEHAGLDRDLSRDTILPNAIKAAVTDLMHESAQSLLQLVGAQGYRLDHIAGRAMVDSRAFQIFEGSNDVLYKTIGESVLRSMRRADERGLLSFLRKHPHTGRAAALVGRALDLRVDFAAAQREVAALGVVVSRLCVVELIIELGARGFRADLIAAALSVFEDELERLLSSYRSTRAPLPIVEYDDESSWSACSHNCE